MHPAGRMSCGILLLCAGMDAKADVLQGYLELRWGDPAAARHGAIDSEPRFHAFLALDGGTRIALDPEQARRAAGDLYALANRRVAVAFSTAKSSGGRRAIEVIVPADAIDGQREHPIAGKADTVAKAVSGATPWITLACRFNDITEEQKPVTFFRGQYGTAAGELGHYWSEVSYGKINLAGSDAKGWYVLPNPRSHYVTAAEPSDGENADLNALFDDCTAAADADVDFSGMAGINLMFNGDLDGYAWGGGRCTPLDGVNRCWATTWNPPWSFNNLAPLAHEMGHGYGLPHSDNSDGDGDLYDNPWDLMSDSWRNAVQDGTYGTRPKHINIYQRDRLGWVDAARKRAIASGAERARVAIDYADLPRATNVQMLLLQTPASPDPYRGTVYVLEARRPKGTYESALAGDAIIIHGVGNEYRAVAQSQDGDRPPATVSNNEGSMFKVGEAWLSADGLFSVYVESKGATGYVVVVGEARSTGGRGPRRRK